MADKTITVNLTGEATLLDQDMVDFAKQYGWTETVTDEEGKEIDNPVSALDFAKAKLHAIVQEAAKAYNVNKARDEAGKATDEAFTAARKK